MERVSKPPGERVSGWLALSHAGCLARGSAAQLEYLSDQGPYRVPLPAAVAAVDGHWSEADAFVVGSGGRVKDCLLKCLVD